MEGTIRKHLMVEWDHNETRVVDWVAGASFVVISAPGGQVYPSVAYNQAGDVYLVVWEDRRSQVASCFLLAKTPANPVG